MKVYFNPKGQIYTFSARGQGPDKGWKILIANVAHN